MLFAALLGTMIGAKLYYVVVVTHNIRDLWSRGGFVFWGGFIGSVILCAATIRYKKLSFPRFADVAGHRDRRGLRGRSHGMLGRGRRLRQAVQRLRSPSRFPTARRRRPSARWRPRFTYRPPPEPTLARVLSVYPTQLVRGGDGLI